ncbi:MAG: CHASE2 domain-containing protein [Limisphaerales bacterium]
MLTVLCGLVLWKSWLGTPLINYSYDTLFLFGNRGITNKVTFIEMDNESFEAFHQVRGRVWDRGLHAQLLDKLAVDNCSVVVLDLLLSRGSDPEKDLDLVRAMRRHHEIAVRAGSRALAETNFRDIEPVFPALPFFNAAGKNWGISRLESDPDGIVRHHWPFPSPGAYPSLAETAARTAGAVIAEAPHERWLRYYGQEPPWTRISYRLALKQPANFFHNQLVFIGAIPKESAPPGFLSHKFLTPYSHWTGRSTPGTEALITEFLNLLNHESLYRWPRMEMFALLFCGLVFGAVLPRLRFVPACVGAVAVSIVVVTLAVTLTTTTNYWFPWLLIVVGQLPVAIVWTFVAFRGDQGDPIEAERRRGERPLEIPGYRLVKPPIAQGAYGEVWLARNKQGEWRAIKVVSLEGFENDHGPYDREYEGITRYRAICDKHPGLLRVEFVSEKMSTHFFCIMELGDGLESGWEKTPGNYKPKDLKRICSLAPQKRLAIEECIRIGTILSDALDFIHRSGLTHRDIKPQNILFVNGQPKLADLGLITNIRPSDQERTAVGTPGYMPPAPEMPGTPAADIYALGMVLYVISTGHSTSLFPELPETLLGDSDPTEFFLLNQVVLKACYPDRKGRYASAREMFCALEQLQHQRLSRVNTDSPR